MNLKDGGIEKSSGTYGMDYYNVFEKWNHPVGKFRIQS